MAKDDQGSNRYKSIALYFDKNSKEDMDIYHFLTVSPRKKTNFIIRLITKYLHDNGVIDIGNITQEKAEYLMKMSIRFDGGNTSSVAIPSSSFSAEEFIKLLAAFINVNGIASTALTQTQANQFSAPAFDESKSTYKKRNKETNGEYKKESVFQQQEKLEEEKQNGEVLPTDMDDSASLTSNSDSGLLENWREGLNVFF